MTDRPHITIADAVRELDAAEPGLSHVDAAARLTAQLGRPVSRHAVHSTRSRPAPSTRGRRPLPSAQLTRGVSVTLPLLLSRVLVDSAAREGRSVRAVVVDLLEAGIAAEGVVDGHRDRRGGKQGRARRETAIRPTKKRRSGEPPHRKK